LPACRQAGVPEFTYSTRIHQNSIGKIFNALENKSLDFKQGIFYDGQIFDAYVFVSGLIKKAKKSITIIDNYIDESVLSMLTKRKKIVDLEELKRSILQKAFEGKL